MHSKVATGVIAICILFILFSGCTSFREGAMAPATETPVATETRTLVQTTAPPQISSEVPAVNTLLPQNEMADNDGTISDTEFNNFFVKSNTEIINKTNSVIQAMAPGSMNVQAVYSPAVLYLKAEDLGFTIERDYDQTLSMKTNTPQTEEKRIAYLHFLYIAKRGAYHIADAAEAESFNDYTTALAMSTAAGLDLREIKVDPDIPPTVPYRTLNVFLAEYVGRVRDKVIQLQNEEANQKPQPGSRSIR
ncbi:MAG: hypothetical protein WCB46_06160 [Methanoregula sp.]